MMLLSSFSRLRHRTSSPFELARSFVRRLCGERTDDSQQTQQGPGPDDNERAALLFPGATAVTDTIGALAPVSILTRSENRVLRVLGTSFVFPGRIGFDPHPVRKPGATVKSPSKKGIDATIITGVADRWQGFEREVVHEPLPSTVRAWGSRCGFSPRPGRKE